MAKLVGPHGFEVPTDYFFRKPRFRPGYVPYTNDLVDICDDSGDVIPGAQMLPDGQVIIPGA